MSQQANFFRLGLFILAAIVVFVALVLALSAGQLLRKTVVLETYFDESVQGLDVGSAVKYRGVQLGRVTRISFTHARYEQDRPLASRRQYVLVESEVDAALVASAVDPDPERMQMKVEQGLRVRIAPVGITGTAYLEIDFLDPMRYPVLSIDWTPANLYIPSAPSNFNQIVSGAQNLIVKLDRLDIETVLNDTRRLLTIAAQKLEQAPVDRLAKDVESTLKEVRVLAQQLNRTVGGPEVSQAVKDLAESSARLKGLLADPQLAQLPADAGAAVARMREILDGPEVRRTLASADRILRRLDELTATSDADIAAALANVRRLSENLRDLSESVRRYPGVLLSDQPRPVVEGAK